MTACLSGRTDLELTQVKTVKLSEFVASHGRLVLRNAGEYLFRQGDPDKSFYIVQSGLLKAYYLSNDGKENIKSFILPGDRIGSLTASFAGQSCSFSLVCLKQCELIVVEFAKLYEFSRQDPEIAADVVDFLLAFAMKKENREYELLCLPAEDRYRRLLDTTPELFDLVTQNEIARYLGITPVGLSRIKKRVLTTA